jgi:hypothetical protein
MAFFAGRVGGDRFCGFKRVAQRSYPVENAPGQAFVGRELPARQNELLGAALAHGAREVLRAGAAGHDAQAHFGQREARAGRGIDEVAGERDLEAAAEGVAVQRRDHRQREFHQRHEAALEQLVLCLPVGGRHAVALLEVGAGAEGALAGTGQDDAAQRAGLGRQARPQLEQVASHLAVERIQHLGTVEARHEHVLAMLLEVQG